MNSCALASEEFRLIVKRFREKISHVSLVNAAISFAVSSRKLMQARQAAEIADNNLTGFRIRDGLLFC